MFFIKVRGKVHEFANAAGDDFIRYLPEHFRCRPEDLEIYMVPKAFEDDKARMEVDGELPVQILADDMSKVSLKVVRGGVEVIADYSLKLLDKWPYQTVGVDKDGNAVLQFNPPK